MRTQNKATATWVIIGALSVGIAGCEPLNVQSPDDQLEFATLDGGYDPAGAKLAFGKFRLMGSKAAQESKKRKVASASIQVVGIEVRTLGGDFLKFEVQPFELDILALREGLGSVLARVKLPPGEFDLLRLQTAEEGQAVLSDGAVLPLRVPSGEQSGLKVFFEPAIKIEAQKLTVGLAEFDVDNSFVITGSDRVHFKPVLRVSVTQPIELGQPPVVVDPDNGGSTGDGSSTGGSTGDGSSTGGSTGDGSSTGGSTGDGSSTGGDVTLPGDGNDDDFLPWIGV